MYELAEICEVLGDCFHKSLGLNNFISCIDITAHSQVSLSRTLMPQSTLLYKNVIWTHSTFQCTFHLKLLAPVVQSIISLTSSLRGQLVKCFTTLLPNTLIFFVEK